MVYKELLQELTDGHNWAKLQPPCHENEISEAEKYVGFDFPEELKALLREVNGDHWLLLSAQEIVERVKINRKYFLSILSRMNLRKRSTAMFSSLQTVAVIITAIAFFPTAKLIHLQYIFGNTSYLRFAKRQKTLLI